MAAAMEEEKQGCSSIKQASEQYDVPRITL